MHPRNVLAIRRTLAGSTASEVITSLTHKSSNATLLDYPTGAYTGMRTFDKIGIMDFTGHTTRLATSLQQIKFSAAHIRAQAQAQTKAQAGTQGQAQAQATANHENHDNDKENDHAIAEEDPAVTAGLAQLRKEDIMKREATTLVRAGLKFYYKQLKEQDAAVAATTGETKVTVLCTWDAQAS
ncbi:hypothetical protein EDD11_003342 [Mortierella claussenii]|nr:hypothetical protein EDD11_003342 [Mortierella claussenii]